MSLSKILLSGCNCGFLMRLGALRVLGCEKPLPAWGDSTTRVRKHSLRSQNLPELAWGGRDSWVGNCLVLRLLGTQKPLEATEEYEVGVHGLDWSAAKEERSREAPAVPIGEQSLAWLVAMVSSACLGWCSPRLETQRCLLQEIKRWLCR